MSLADLVHPRPSLPPSASVQEAVHLMARHDLGALPVSDGVRLAGIFTERDLMRKVVLWGRDPATTPIGQVMTSPVETIAASASIEEAAEVMRGKHIRHLAVLADDGHLLGLVPLRYLLFQMMGGLERKVDDLESFIMTDGPGG